MTIDDQPGTVKLRGMETRIMRCPFCGHVTKSGGIGAVYCGPHKLDNGEYWPAQQMHEILCYAAMSRPERP